MSKSFPEYECRKQLSVLNNFECVFNGVLPVFIYLRVYVYDHVLLKFRGELNYSFVHKNICWKHLPGKHDM